ncbi:MAG: D-2-hydroxyacid dehydrogenase [Geminicoccaceae bacterium]|nr:D-2-hydroxyacid dehydrogenase [Geminicoccaceae bacterium]
MTTPSERLLIAHSNADSYAPQVRQRFPDIELAIARDENELAGLLPDFIPTIAYSCTTRAFPRHLHRPIMEQPGLRWLHVGGSGYEHFSGLDVQRITLTNGRGVLAGFQADTVMGAIIALNHDFHGFRTGQQQRRFEARRFRGLAGQRLLVVGAGAIGRAVIGRAAGFGFHITAVTRDGRRVEGCNDATRLDELPRAVTMADIVSLHLPLNEQTRHIIDARLLAAMKHDAILVNTARGAVVDEAALIAELDRGRFRGVYLDVFENEPLPPESPLWAHERVMITPHCSDQVEDWEDRHAMFFIDNLQRWVDGRRLENVVSQPLPSPSS